MMLTIMLVQCYINPVQGDHDSPDPGVLFYNNTYYAVTTGGWDAKTFPIWQSTTGTNFTHVGWVFGAGPSWTRCCDYWAPELHIVDGKFTVYFTARA
jgi:arabinan endo-1,5-alpha-L-arabinosidase